MGQGPKTGVFGSRSGEMIVKRTKQKSRTEQQPEKDGEYLLPPTPLPAISHPPSLTAIGWPVSSVGTMYLGHPSFSARFLSPQMKLYFPDSRKSLIPLCLENCIRSPLFSSGRIRIGWAGAAHLHLAKLADWAVWWHGMKLMSGRSGVTHHRLVDNAPD